MNYSSIKIMLMSAVLFFGLHLSSVFAASLRIEAPRFAPSTRETITVYIALDAEQDAVSGVAGSFSFPKELFTVESITRVGSVVSLWSVEPHVSEEKYLDNRTHIVFEGIFPGGFDGVRSPYYQGKRPGILFAVQLVPKEKGEGSFIIDDILLNSFSSDAKPLPVDTVVEPVGVPALHDALPRGDTWPVRVESKTTSLLITRDPLVEHNAWYVLVHDTSKRASIAGLYVAETNDYNAELVSESSWRIAKNPYVLLYQDRSKFVHVKIMYTDNTYTTLTLPPVENSSQISQFSRILVSIIIVLFVMYLYARSFFSSSLHTKHR